jgi:hypothetical protein
MRVLLWICRRLHCGRWLPLALVVWQRTFRRGLFKFMSSGLAVGHPLMRARRAIRHCGSTAVG